MSNTPGKFEKLATKIGSLVDEKNKAYGDSFAQAGDFLRLLFPFGVPPDKYTDMLAIIRIFDKLKRIATNKDAFAESPYSDIVGYGLLGVHNDNIMKEAGIKGEKEIDEAAAAFAASALSELKKQQYYAESEDLEDSEKVRVEETIEALSDILLNSDVTYSISDDYTRGILVTLPKGAMLAKELPKSLNGFQIVVERGGEIIPYHAETRKNKEERDAKKTQKTAINEAIEETRKEQEEQKGKPPSLYTEEFSNFVVEYTEGRQADVIKFKEDDRIRKEQEKQHSDKLAASLEVDEASLAVDEAAKLAIREDIKKRNEAHYAKKEQDKKNLEQKKKDFEAEEKFLHFKKSMGKSDWDEMQKWYQTEVGEEEGEVGQKSIISVKKTDLSKVSEEELSNIFYNFTKTWQK